MVGEVPLQFDPDSESGVEGAVDLELMGKVFLRLFISIYEWVFVSSYFNLSLDLVVESVGMDQGFVVINGVFLQHRIPHPRVVHLLVVVSNWRRKTVKYFYFEVKCIILTFNLTAL